MEKFQSGKEGTLGNRKKNLYVMHNGREGSRTVGVLACKFDELEYKIYNKKVVSS